MWNFLADTDTNACDYHKLLTWPFNMDLIAEELNNSISAIFYLQRNIC